MSSAFILLMICVVVLCIILIFLILSQNPKGGGLSSTFGGSGTQMFGVKNTNDFMDKATWTVASAIAIIIILSGIMIANPTSVVEDEEADIQTEQTDTNGNMQNELPKAEVPTE
ncbi:MAG: preprotein translocase subunit SecG [Flavobacteriales bacterium]|nr:preprotein translocase subunit SecG [Flavobacteriales bacterium]